MNLFLQIPSLRPGKGVFAMSTYMSNEVWDVVVIGGGLAGLSAAIYLARASRRVLVVHSGHSMAVWEPDVQNYLGFPNGISGADLLARGREQAMHYGATLIVDEVRSLKGHADDFAMDGLRGSYRGRRVLLATGLTHLPPDIPGVRECLGRSLFFCKDCDAYRMQHKRIAIIGWNREAAEYALAMLAFTPTVCVTTHGREPAWPDAQGRWLAEYGVPVHRERIISVDHADGCLHGVTLEGATRLDLDAMFTVRGDLYHTQLAHDIGATCDEVGQLVIDHDLQTNVRGVYAAGCVTPANCQMIIAAGQGAAAAQAINRDLFCESLERHALPRARAPQEVG